MGRRERRRKHTTWAGGCAFSRPCAVPALLFSRLGTPPQVCLYYIFVVASAAFFLLNLFACCTCFACDFLDEILASVSDPNRI